MVAETTIFGFAYLVTGTSLLFLLLEPLKQPGNPGSKGFAVAITGVGLWPIALGVNYFVADPTFSVGLWYVRMLAAALIGVGWFLLAVTVTTSEDLADRLALPLGGYVVLTQLIVWTDPWHHLVVDPTTTLDGTVLMVVDGPWFWVQAAVNYGLIVGSTMLLANDYLESTGVGKKQSGLLALAPVPPGAANLVSIFDATATVHDLTPFGLIGSGVLLTYALYRVGFLDIAPIARAVAMENMRDAVVTLDTEGSVVDCNDRAEALFAPPADYAGRPAEEFFAAVPSETRERFANVTDVDTEVSTTVDGETRHFSIAISPVTERGRQLGRVLVLHDITEIKERERQLESREAQLNLLRQVLSRILRHNIRNKLVTIQGNAAEIRRESEDQYARERSELIDEASDSLLAITEKARTVEDIVDGAEERVPVDLRTVARGAIDEFEDVYPDVTFVAAGLTDCRVRAMPGLETAVSYLVENAAKYNDAPDPTVTVRVSKSDGCPSLAVVDNGPGIPDHEVNVLEEERETALSHSDGIGLWLVKWTANASGATLDFDTDGDGTTARIRFEADPSVGH